MQMTSAQANKLLKKLNDDKNFLLNQERSFNNYVVALGETPVIPEFNFVENATKINDIDCQIRKIKHSINVANSTHGFTINNKTITIDEALIYMAQLTTYKKRFDILRQCQPKKRLESFAAKTPEYQCINYEIKDAQEKYELADKTLTELQLKLDEYNQTVLFDVDYVS